VSEHKVRSSAVPSPKVQPKVENAIRTHLSAGNGILKVAALVGCGSGTVQRVKREMMGELV
jgi:LytS/YehU family sensor histidine kinase